jgi:hypothetical protein
VLADRKPLPARFLVLGSASPELLRQSSETLAGRIETIAMSGFSRSDRRTRFALTALRTGSPRSFRLRTKKRLKKGRKTATLPTTVS